MPDQEAAIVERVRPTPLDVLYADENFCREYWAEVHAERAKYALKPPPNYDAEYFEAMAIMDRYDDEY